MKASIYTLISIGTLVAACVGDDPVGSGPGTADGGSLDGGGSSGSNSPGNASVELSVTPLEIAHGSPGTIEVQLVRRGSTAPVTLSVQSNLLGAEASGTITVPANEVAARRSLSFSTTLATPTGGTSDLYVVATASDMADVRIVVPLFVRGVPGELDTSYGSQGTAGAPVGGSRLADAVVMPDGGMFAIGNDPAVIAAYDANGALRSDFGTGGFQAPAIPQDPSDREGTLAGLQLNSDGSLSAVARGFAYGYARSAMFAFSLLKLDIQASSPFALTYTPATKGGTISTACSQRTWPTLHATGFRIITNGEAGNCIYPPTARAFDTRTAPISTFGTDGVTLLDPANQHSMRVSSVRTVGDATYVLSMKVEPGDVSTTKTHTLSSIALGTGAVKRVPMGKAQTPDEYTAFNLHFSEPHADGRLLAIRSAGTMPCIVAVLPSGDLDPNFPQTCLNNPRDADGRYAGGTFLGRGFAVVALGTESSLWTSTDGSTLSAKTILPTLVGGPTAEIVHVFEAPNRRILVLTRDDEVAPWSIKRFWL